LAAARSAEHNLKRLKVRSTFSRLSSRALAERLELRLEEGLVDLALVDRDTFLHADPDHLLPIDPELFRQFLRREVIRHAGLLLPRALKNPPAPSAQTGSSRPSLVVPAGFTRPAPQKDPSVEEYAPVPTYATPFEERELGYASTRLRYRVAGSGPPVVLVHGLGGAAGNWRLIAPALAESHRVIVPDLPGHGRSGPIAAARDLDPFAEAVLAVLEAEAALPAVWVGHSLGGVVGVRAAVIRPGAIRGLVLAAAAGISSATRIGEVTVTVLGLVQPGKLVAPQRHRIARSRAGRTVAFGWWGVADPAALDPEMAEAFLAGPAQHTDTHTAGKALLGSDPRRDLERVECPCLCLWGACDNWVPLQDGFEYARRLRAPLRTIADCGHLLIGERPDAVLAAVREFIVSLG
jgi:pimeloyl-ACP methyl ester carboxylesterase